MSEVKQISKAKHLRVFLRQEYLRYNDVFSFTKLTLFNLLFTFLHFPTLLTRFIFFCGRLDDYICATRIKNSPTCVLIRKRKYSPEKVGPNQLPLITFPETHQAISCSLCDFLVHPKNFPRISVLLIYSVSQTFCRIMKPSQILSNWKSKAVSAFSQL